MVFAIQACGFSPRCALEADDAGEERLAKILRIIAGCHLGVHDLSRKGSDPGSGMSRFNMPYEMGLFQGAAHFGKKKKIMLIMEAEQFDYRRFVSDISGRDISHHGNSPERLITLIREWLSSQRIVGPLPGGLAISLLYRQFLADLPQSLDRRRLHRSEVEFPHFLNWSYLVAEWLGDLIKG